MPQAIPFILAAAKAALPNLLVAAASRAAMTLIEKALFKRPGSGAPPLNVTVSSTVTERKVIYGTVRAGGALVFARTSGTNNKYLWYVVVYAGRQVSDIKDLWLDRFKIADADINPSTGDVSTSSLDGKLKCWTYLGTQAQTADSGLDTDFSDWTSNHRLRGCPYRVLRFERSDKAWPTGAPQACSSLVEGSLIYDPRLDSTNGGSGSHRRDNPSTWAYSNNWALCVRDYLSGGSVVNDQATRLIRYGVQEDDARIEDAYTIASANLSDQSLSGGNAPPSGAQVRYTLDIEVSCGQTRREILEEMLVCGGASAQLVSVHGTWRIYASAYDAPVHTFTEQHMHGGEIEVDDTFGDEDRFNQITALFVDASKEYVEQTTPVRSDAAYVTQDGGREIPKEIVIRGVTDQYRAQRVAEQVLRRGRQMRRVRIPFGRPGLKIAPWETFTFSHEPLGWSSRVFRCIEREPTRDEKGGLIVWITADAETSSIYTDLATADYTTGTSNTNALQSEPPDAPTSLTATTRAGAIEFSWTMPSAFWEKHGLVELWEYTANTPFSSATRIWVGSGNRVTIEKTDQTTRYYWIRIVTRGGQASSTEPASNGLAGTAYFAVIGTTVSDTPADSSIAYGAVTQPQIEATGIASHISYTSPAGVATRCVVNYSGQANVSNTTSGVAVGYASIMARVFVNSSPVWSREARLEAVLNANDAWATLSGSKSFDVPAGQTIDVYLDVGRSFSTGGASPAQTIYWRACHTEIMPTKQT